MLYRIKIWLSFLLFFLFGINSVAQKNENTVDTITNITIYYPYDSYDLNKNYLSNNNSFERLKGLLCDSIFVNSIDSIYITSTSSPEGKEEYNKKLSTNRAIALKDYILREYPRINNDLIKTKIISADWDGFKAMIINDLNVPNRDKVLSELEREATSDARQWRLKIMYEGESWKYIKENFLQYLRTGTTCIVYYKKITSVSPKEFKTIEPLAANEIIPIVLDHIISSSKPILKKKPEYTRKPFASLKTNLLFDLATMLNVELEIPICDKISIAGEWIFPWWLLEEKQYCLQLLCGNAEIRYWLGNRNKKSIMEGWFAGLYAGGGKYDLGFGMKGFQGEFFIASGLSCGYQHKIAKNFSLEYSLGVGYLKTNYRKYIPKEDGEILAWQNDGRYTFVGPTRAKVSLVWTLSRKVKKGVEK